MNDQNGMTIRTYIIQSFTKFSYLCAAIRKEKT